MKQYLLVNDDNINALKQFQDNSIDACITDPPYGMNMGDWDNSVPLPDVWQEVYRVLKPGAFVVSFCSPQLYHRMATNIETGGFMPKDMIFWIITTKMAQANKLKPAHEPIMIAQKPLDGTIKANWEKWGCGRVNIESGRIPWQGDMPKKMPTNGHSRRAFGQSQEYDNILYKEPNAGGRYPSNVIGLFDDGEHQKYFYAPRVNRKERGEYNTHPTPKPIDLMRYLVRLYAPQGGMVLDPFMGSGSTAIAALQEDRSFKGIDSNPDYVNITELRINDHIGTIEQLGE